MNKTDGQLKFVKILPIRLGTSKLPILTSAWAWGKRREGALRVMTGSDRMQMGL